jgi:hypothetical protein
MKSRSAVLGLLTLGVVSQLMACGVAGDQEEETTHDELAADRNALPTSHATIKAGDPYSPVLDERPLAIDTDEPCVKSPRIEITPGRTEIDAKVVSSRRDLMNRLDLGVEGIPINVAKLAGATGTARLAVETKLSEAAMTILFQARGTFESTMVGAGAELPKFDPARVDKCGWGYVKKAHHRLAAVVMVTIESTDHSRRVLLGCGQGEDDCTGTSISAGPVAAKASIENTLKAGSFNISVRSLADAIPDLPSAPLGDMVALSSTPETASETMDKLGKALDWLGRVETAIQEQMLAIQANPGTQQAPTSKIEFAYYPGLTDGERAKLASTYDDVIALRTTTRRRSRARRCGKASVRRGRKGTVTCTTCPTLPSGRWPSSRRVPTKRSEMKASSRSVGTRSSPRSIGATPRPGAAASPR